MKNKCCRIGHIEVEVEVTKVFEVAEEAKQGENADEEEKGGREGMRRREKEAGQDEF